MTFQTLAKHNELRRTASLRIRCLDCNGALIATITWRNGLPIIQAKEEAKRMWVYSYADRGTVLHARHGTHRHAVPLDDVRAQLPPPGAPRAEMKIRHTSPS